MFEGIIGESSISCKQGNRVGVLYADNSVTEVDSGNVIGSTSIQPVSDSNVSSSALIVIDSV